MDMQAAIVGDSKPLREVLARADRAAPTNLSVLIEGETGTGKELLARYVHARSGTRSKGPFVAINCAAIPKDLFESELFGHERGAFTGAHATKIGAFERAHGGTLFLDEIGDLALDHQAKLLRALQQCEVQRIGSDMPRRVDLRVIAATHRELRAAAGSFRDDLYFRLAAVILKLPPLRERGRDVLAIANRLLQREFPAKMLSRTAQQCLLTHAWPGNIRELENVVRAAALDSDASRIDAAVLEAQPAFANAEEPGNRVDRVRLFLQKHSRITAADVRALLGLQRVQVTRLLGSWERDGLLVRRSGGASTYYVAADKPHLAVVR